MQVFNFAAHLVVNKVFTYLFVRPPSIINVPPVHLLSNFFTCAFTQVYLSIIAVVARVLELGTSKQVFFMQKFLKPSFSTIEKGGRSLYINKARSLLNSN